MASDETRSRRGAAQYARRHLRRPRPRHDAARPRHVSPDQVVDVQFTDFIADPFATIRALYDQLGRAQPEPSRGCAPSSPPTPGDGGGSRYRWADTGLDAGWCASGRRRTRSTSASRRAAPVAQRGPNPPKGAISVGRGCRRHRTTTLPVRKTCRPAFGGRVLAVVVRAATVDLHVIDRGARPVGKAQVQAAELDVQLDHHDRVLRTRPGEVEVRPNPSAGAGPARVGRSTPPGA